MSPRQLSRLHYRFWILCAWITFFFLMSPSENRLKHCPLVRTRTHHIEHEYSTCIIDSLIMIRFFFLKRNENKYNVWFSIFRDARSVRYTWFRQRSDVCRVLNFLRRQKRRISWRLIVFHGSKFWKCKINPYRFIVFVETSWIVFTRLMIEIAGEKFEFRNGRFFFRKSRCTVKGICRLKRGTGRGRFERTGRSCAYMIPTETLFLFWLCKYN